MKFREGQQFAPDTARNSNPGRSEPSQLQPSFSWPIQLPPESVGHPVPLLPSSPRCSTLTEDCCAPGTRGTHHPTQPRQGSQRDRTAVKGRFRVMGRLLGGRKRLFLLLKPGSWHHIVAPAAHCLEILSSA